MKWIIIGIYMSILRKIIVYNNINKEEDRFYKKNNQHQTKKKKIYKYLSETSTDTLSSFV